jgi:hypothetical protein
MWIVGVREGRMERWQHIVERVLGFFLQSSDFGPTTPSLASECVSSPFGSGGGDHTRLRERMWGSPNSDEGTDTVGL